MFLLADGSGSPPAQWLPAGMMRMPWQPENNTNFTNRCAVPAFNTTGAKHQPGLPNQRSSKLVKLVQWINGPPWPQTCRWPLNKDKPPKVVLPSPSASADLSTSLSLYIYYITLAGCRPVVLAVPVFFDTKRQDKSSHTRNPLHPGHENGEPKADEDVAKPHR